MTVAAADVRMIPVDQIAVLNPRSRNKRIFSELVTSTPVSPSGSHRPSLGICWIGSNAATSTLPLHTTLNRSNL